MKKVWLGRLVLFPAEKEKPRRAFPNLIGKKRCWQYCATLALCFSLYHHLSAKAETTLARFDFQPISDDKGAWTNINIIPHYYRTIQDSSFLFPLLLMGWEKSSFFFFFFFKEIRTLQVCLAGVLMQVRC